MIQASPNKKGSFGSYIYSMTSNSVHAAGSKKMQGITFLNYGYAGPTDPVICF